MRKIELIILLNLVLLILNPAGLFSQLANPKRNKTTSARTTSPFMSSGEEKISLEEKGLPVPTTQALEQVINPDQYVVGPGDMFYVNVSGEADLMFPSQVTPEGLLIVETIGIFKADGKRLSQLQSDIRQAGKTKYKMKDVFANLVQLRSFRVHVVGEVVNPGTYVAQAVDRVSVVIDRAESLTDWADERHIEIRHTNGQIDSLDLFQFKKLGDLSENIFVQNGDIIYVPAIDLIQKTVILEGLVRQPGIHQITENESLSSFLLRVDAFNRSLDPQNIYVVRQGEKGEKKIFNINLLGSKNGNKDQRPVDVALQNGDHIFVPSLKNRVYVHGAVNIPGGYSYMAGFKIQDYVGLAGGTTEMGNVKGIKVIHLRDNSVEQGMDVAVDRGDTIIVPLSFRKEFAEYLQIFSGLATLVFAFMAAQN
ncbi:MAG: SLBB domain-containing protein [Candidatus Zhuqueibacterota bacterium]